jgi:hypothetical protein
VFVHGQLHNAPFTFVFFEGSLKDGCSLSKMQNGRPAEGSMCTCFFGNGNTIHVDSKEAKTDVSGW